MTYIKRGQIEEMKKKYGVPRELKMVLEITPPEFNMLCASRKNERSHDITLFIFKDRDYREFAAIAKHFFPVGVYRAPSGAAHPGEDFENGAKREALEETGLEIELDRFILIIHATFTCGPEFEDWTSYIFTAFRKSGRLEHRDKEEISETRWLTLEELQNEVREKLMATDIMLFHYRLALHDYSVEEIKKLRSGEQES